MRPLLLALLLAVSTAAAEPLAQIERDGVRIVLYSELCELTGKIKNLQLRAEWTGRSRVYQGCWSLSPLRLVVMFFDDLTVEAIPLSAFIEVKDI